MEFEEFEKRLFDTLKKGYQIKEERCQELMEEYKEDIKETYNDCLKSGKFLGGIHSLCYVMFLEA